MLSFSLKTFIVFKSASNSNQHGVLNPTPHKKWSFPLRISSVNVIKSKSPQEIVDLVTFTEENT